jgi:ribonuclease HI
MTRSSVPPGSARLFTESHSAPPAGVYTANIDGASRGNPGPASYAVILRDPNGKVVLELAKKLGRDTNNVAEYYALLAALDYAVTHGIKSLRVRSDSELLVRQMQGRYKVKSADLKPLHERAAKLSRQLEYFVIEHVPREANRDADALANVALDSSGTGAIQHESRTDSRAASRGRAPTSSLSLNDSPSVSPAKTIRARFHDGVFVPAENVTLPEGSEVILTIHKP